MDVTPHGTRPAKALERPPCRTGSSPLNDATGYLGAAGVNIYPPPASYPLKNSVL